MILAFQSSYNFKIRMLARLWSTRGGGFQNFSTSSPQQPWLFIGLGNPGSKFQGTRHNVGFEMIGEFSDSLGILLNTLHCKALFGQGFVGDAPVLLAKPQTYMNLSGESVGLLASYYKLPLSKVLVIHDDMELPCGVLRLQDKGGHGSHNGLKSVMDHFGGNREFARLRIGIGKPPGQMDPKAFLLQKFNVLARERVDAALKEGVSVLKLIPSEGLAECARWFNKEQKYKHIMSQKTFKLEGQKSGETKMDEFAITTPRKSPPSPFRDKGTTLQKGRRRPYGVGE